MSIQWHLVHGRVRPCRPDGTVCGAHDPQVLRELLTYDPLTGRMTWQTRTAEMFTAT